MARPAGLLISLLPPLTHHNSLGASGLWGAAQMRFIIFLIIVGGIFWAIDKSAYSRHCTQLAEENAAHLAKAIGDDLRGSFGR